MSRNAAEPLPALRQHPLLRALSSIWFGLAVLALILIYSSVISALAPVRWATEMTEMQAFRHWLFVALVALFVLSLLAATLIRTRWTLLTAGGILAHVGLLLLVGGAYAYFGTKVEGDVLLRAPAIQVRAHVNERPILIAELRAATGETWGQTLSHIGKPVAVRILSTQAAGVQPVASADVAVTLGQAAPHSLRLTAGADDWQAVGDGVEIHLATYPAQRFFYDDEVPALYLRNLASGTEIVKPIARLPIYREHYVPLPDEGVLRDEHGLPYPPRRERPEASLFGLRIPTGWFEPWRMPIDVDSAGLPFDVQITGYAPFVAKLQAVTPAPAADPPATTPPDSSMRLAPVLEMRENRRPDVQPRSMSAIRLRFTSRGVGPAQPTSRGVDATRLDGRGSAPADPTWTQWCLFSMYPDVDAHPITVSIPGTNATWEVTYSRARHELGATLAARRLNVNYFPGRRNIDSFHSDIDIQDRGGPARPETVSTNKTVRIGPWTLFQSGFDFDEHWRYTILGVGNRTGMWAMNAGWIVTTLGCLLAFYIKPMLVRRAKERL